GATGGIQFGHRVTEIVGHPNCCSATVISNTKRTPANSNPGYEHSVRGKLDYGVVLTAGYPHVRAIPGQPSRAARNTEGRRNSAVHWVYLHDRAIVQVCDPEALAVGSERYRPLAHSIGSHDSAVAGGYLGDGVAELVRNPHRSSPVVQQSFGATQTSTRASSNL